MIYNKEIELLYNVDVFVAGGGPAGVAAAVAAARSGKSVYLAEAQGSFGGLATAGLVPAFAVFGNGVDILCRGIGLEIRKKVSRDFPIDTRWTPINVEELKRAYDEIVEASGAEYSFFTTLCDVIKQGDRVESVILSSKSGLFAVKAKIYIDCTGDGDLCALAGAEFEQGDEKGGVMPATLCSIWANIDFSRTVPDASRLEEAISDGVFEIPDRHLPGIYRTDAKKGIGGGNVGHVAGVDPTDVRSLTEAMVKGRKVLTQYEKYYTEYLLGYEKAALVSSAGILGVRESRRIKCDYTLTIDDFVERRVFDDEIGRYCYPVDIHADSTDKAAYQKAVEEYKTKYRYKDGESYGIPYRSLIPKDLSNVLVAGRCIGSDRRMQSSIRVMPGCFITGEAAGTAAALASDSGETRLVDTKVLQERLKSNALKE